MPTAHARPGKTLLTPEDHVLILIDHQSQMAFATKSIDEFLSLQQTANMQVIEAIKAGAA